MIFLMDECVARPIILSLRKHFPDVRSVAEEAPGLSDREVLMWAQRDARVLVTEDYDFGHLAFQTALPAYAIVIIGPHVFRGDEADSADGIAGRIARLAEDLVGRLTLLDRHRTRQRDLP